MKSLRRLLVAALLLASGCSHAWRGFAPEIEEQSVYTAPAVRRIQYGNGLTVLVVERKDLPLVSVSVATRVGSIQDPAGRAGLARLTHDLLLEGAGARDAVDLAGAFADLGAEPRASVGAEGTSLRLHVLSDRLEPTLALLSDVLRRPHFAPDAFERRRASQLRDIAWYAEDPDAAASLALNQAVFGADHPYGRPSSGRPADLKAISLDDVRAFYRRWYGPKNAAVVLVGNVDLHQAAKLVARYFGSWQREVEVPAAAPPIHTAERKGVVFVPMPGLTHAVISLGRSGPADSDPRVLAARAATSSFSSMLYTRLRKEKGWTYSARASYEPGSKAGFIAATASVRSEVTAQAVERALGALGRFRQWYDTPVGVVSFRIGGYSSTLFEHRSLDATAVSVTRLFLLGEPLDVYHREIKALESLKGQKVKDVIDAYFVDDAMQVVVVGDPSVEESLKALGPVVERSPASVAGLAP